MKKSNRNKILACGLALLLLFQGLSLPAYADELGLSSSKSVSKTEKGKVTGEKAEKAVKKNNSYKVKAVYNKIGKALLAENEGQEADVAKEDGIIDIKSSADFIKLSNRNASEYYDKTIRITRADANPFDLTGEVDGKIFNGLGTTDYPFKGRVTVTNGDTNDIDIPVNRSFFNYLDQSATIDNGVYLKAKGNVSGALLAENYVNKYGTTEAGNISLKVKCDNTDANASEENEDTFGGIIGTMAEGTKLNLSVNNKSDVGKTIVKGSGNLGFFCNTMEKDSALTIAYEGFSDYNLSATSGNAGGLVGEMKKNASLTIANTLDLTGNVKTTGAKSAGGLVGCADNPTILLTGSSKINRSGTVECNSNGKATGGYIGLASYSGSGELDFTDFEFDVKLNNGNHAGGLFGVLNFDAENKNLTLKEIKKIRTTFSGTSWQTGGLIGQYSAKDLSSALNIKDVDVESIGEGSTTVWGGLVGFQAGSGADSALSGSGANFVEIENAKVDMKRNSGTTNGALGGLVAEMGEHGYFLSVKGKNTVVTDSRSCSNTGDSSANFGFGGVLGMAEEGGVIRLSGETDLSGVTFTKRGNKFGQIAGNINGTVIYAMGSGNGDGTGDYGWKYIRPTETSFKMTVSDIGTYGEVIRLDGTNLKEKSRTGIKVDPSNIADDNELIDYYSDTHEIVIGYNARSTLNIKNTRDLAALSMIMQSGFTSNKGAYCNAYGPESSPLSKNITLDASVTGALDLSGTGVTGMLRDDGSQQYTGTFDGNNKTVKLATGQAYGYCKNSAIGTPVQAENNNGKKNSGRVGIGQIYNHSTIGFIPYLKGTVKDLTLEGFTYFNNANNGVTVSCGNLAGKADDATVNNVTVKSDIVYHDGEKAEKNAVIYIGGLMGTAQGTVNFNECQMEGNLSCESGCFTFDIGGYIAKVNANSKVNFNNCKIISNNDKVNITHEKFDSSSVASNGRFGGLISSALSSDINISDLIIDGLSMKSYSGGVCGGLFGFEWNNCNVNVKNSVLKNSSLDVKGTFGGLVNQTSGYWKVGDGAVAGVTFEQDVTLQGKTSADDTSALMIRSTEYVESNQSNYTYLEILKDGLIVNDNAVTVTLTGGSYFDDIAGKSKYGASKNSVISIGLTAPNATEAVLVNQDECNTWSNKCTVNFAKSYTNKNTRYYYNVDHYRKVAGDSVTQVDNGGKLLLWSLNRYTAGTANNLSKYFKTGGNMTGNIDLTGISYYPVAASLNIENATVTFDYQNMNTKETENANKPFEAQNLQHYQMQTGLFSDVSASSSNSVNLSVNDLTLKGTFGKYTDSAAGVLICNSTSGYDANHRDSITIKTLKLEGIRCANSTDLPLLINSAGSYTSINMDDVTFNTNLYDNTLITNDKKPVASALMGQIGSANAEGISLDFANMGLNGKKDESIFKVATFATAFMYKDTASGGVYNFEKDTTKVTYGREISNGIHEHQYNRNPYDENAGTGQVWYFDTFGETGAEAYVTPNGPGGAIGNFSTGYLPYIGHYEDKNNKYYELDVNQRAIFLAEGCGTYGHPWKINNVLSPIDHKKLFAGEDQLKAVMNLLDGKGSGTAVKINTAVLDKKLAGQGTVALHDNDNVPDTDITVLKKGTTWYEAEQEGSTYKVIDGGRTFEDEQILAYIRNGYYQINDDLTLDISNFTGIGGEAIGRAFSGVIIGDTDSRKVTLTGTAKDGKVGGLIRYSQGSVVKNLNIDVSGVTVPSGSTTTEKTFFGSVIGWVIGGDNIIDKVSLTCGNNALSVTGANEKLTAVGGYVGLVGGDDSRKGGGVIFRNISSAGLTEVSGKAVNEETTEADQTNDRYYWNPYVGRVLDGYACAEKSNCTNMGDNTNKNYKIPKLDKSDKLTVKADGKTNSGSVDLYANSTIKPDTAQDFWLLSAIISSGFGAKATNDFYADSKSSASYGCVDASYYGRTRRDKYDHVGNADADKYDGNTDDDDYWGGNNTGNHKKTSKNYLASYINATGISGANAENIMYALAFDSNHRNMIVSEGEYDLTSYGNGFRGIGQSYVDGVGSTVNNKLDGNIQSKVRCLRMFDKGSNNLALMGEGSNTKIKYDRSINEYESDVASVKQAGFILQFYFNGGSNDKYSISNIEFSSNIKFNFKKTLINNNTQTTDLKYGTRAGILFASDGWKSERGRINFNNVSVSDSSIENANHAGGLCGYVTEWSQSGSSVPSDAVKYSKCSVNGLSINNTDKAGGYVGYLIAGYKKTTFENCTAENVTINNAVKNGGTFIGETKSGITFKRNTNAGTAMTETVKNCTIKSCRSEVDQSDVTLLGGVIGKGTSFTLNGTEAFPVIIDNLEIDATKITRSISNNESNSYIGGLTGDSGNNTISNVEMKNINIAGANVGGAFGIARGANRVKNFDISNSKLICIFPQQVVGGIAGYFTGGGNGLYAFNTRSDNNLIGYLIKEGTTKIDQYAESMVGGVNFENMTGNNVGRCLEGINYYSYSKLNTMTDYKLAQNNGTATKNDRIGIWVGDAYSSNNIRIVAASRKGPYSGILNVGNRNSDDNYVIYADYAGTATGAGQVNVKPESPIILDTNAVITGDGASSMTDGTHVRDKIISDTMEKSYMKGYYGAVNERSLDPIVSKFAASPKGEYYDRLSTYNQEENGYNGNDFPILVLNAASKDEINRILRNYISILTNRNQTGTNTANAIKFDSITPTTYAYSDSKWNKVATADQTMSADTSDKTVRIRSGKYDNTKKQITIVDVTYNSPENSDNKYHLYIPILVKKIIDASFTVDITNGATGYGSAYKGQQTLAGFGENLTAKLSFSYKWTKTEWEGMIANGESLLWNYDKNINLGEFGGITKYSPHMTLVDMNTHGNEKSYCQLDNITSSNFTISNDTAEDYHMPYLCDLMKFSVQPADANDTTKAKYKVVSDDAKTATIRVWDGKKYVYYAPKDASDAANTAYFNISIDMNPGSDGILELTENYYLVMNYKKAKNETAELKNLTMSLESMSFADNKPPVPVNMVGKEQKVYAIGDFYNINNLTLNTQSKNGNAVMKSGDNDYIVAEAKSHVKAVNTSFNQYVNGRYVYMQYAIHLVDENGNPAKVYGPVSASEIKLGEVSLNQIGDLNSDAEGYVLEVSGNTCYVTVKAKGDKYIDKDITAKIKFDYTDVGNLYGQFPSRKGDGREGISFKADASMAYTQESFGSSSMNANTNIENKSYYLEDISRAALRYDSYNISAPGASTSQLGINGRSYDEAVLKTRALFDGSNLSDVNVTAVNDVAYPAYLNCTLSLERKTETDDDGSAYGKTYSRVDIDKYLKEFHIESDGSPAIDGTVSKAADGNVYTFRISLTDKQIREFFINPIVIDIDYKALAGSKLEEIEGSKYANYKVTLSTVLTNADGANLSDIPSNYLVYTNTKVYENIVGAN